MNWRSADVIKRPSPWPAVAALSATMIASAWGAPAPGTVAHFHIPAVQGVVDADSLRGQVVLLDFWASWCVPCAKSFPWMSELSKRRAADGLTIVAVNLDKRRELADDFLEKHPAPFTVAFDPSGKVAEAFHVSGMPSSVLIGRDGTILESHVGFDPKKAAAFEARIAEALKR
jgi:thiol-disulfide isomerase/thioredoxin